MAPSLTRLPPSHHWPLPPSFPVGDLLMFPVVDLFLIFQKSVLSFNGMTFVSLSRYLWLRFGARHICHVRCVCHVRHIATGAHLDQGRAVSTVIVDHDPKTKIIFEPRAYVLLLSLACVIYCPRGRLNISNSRGHIDTHCWCCVVMTVFTCYVEGRETKH